MTTSIEWRDMSMLSRAAKYLRQRERDEGKEREREVLTLRAVRS